MLENLTSLSIADFGRVESGGLDVVMNRMGYTIIKRRDIYEKQVVGMFINRDSETIVDIFEGTAVLYVGRKTDELHTFLLDKTTVIKKNIYFFVTPLLTRATISISTKGKNEYIEIPPTRRPIGINPTLDISHIYTLLYHEKELGFHFRGEKHNFWELTYVDKGNMYNVTGRGAEKKTLPLKQGNLMLFTPDQQHSQFADESVSVCYITIGFDMNYPHTELFEDVVFDSDTEIKRLLEKIFKENETQSIYSNDLILCYLKEIIIRLIRSHSLMNILTKADHASKSYIENDISSYVMEYIKKNIHKKLTVGEIAKSIPVNASYLSTLFKHTTGMTLIEYIGQQKLDKAKDYIRSGKYTFTQIAEMLSFNSVHYFSKLFKKQFGITPSEYAGAIKK